LCFEALRFAAHHIRKYLPEADELQERVDGRLIRHRTPRCQRVERGRDPIRDILRHENTEDVTALPENGETLTP
jgi:hypothetical protein